jgi:hypothetical protein
MIGAMKGLFAAVYGPNAYQRLRHRFHAPVIGDGRNAINQANDNDNNLAERNANNMAAAAAGAVENANAANNNNNNNPFGRLVGRRRPNERPNLNMLDDNNKSTLSFLVSYISINYSKNSQLRTVGKLSLFLIPTI